MYLPDSEIRKRLNIPERKWQPAVLHFERMGFPRRDPMIGMRYWPAVEAWMMQRYSGGSTLRTPDVDEEEDWNALKKRRARA